MKTRKKIPIIMLIVAALFVSCSDEPFTSKGNLNLSFMGENIERTLGPVGSDAALLEIASYDYILKTPSNMYIKGTDQASSVTINDLVIGSYTISVYGKNSAGVVIAEGTKTFKVQRGTNNITVTLDALTGTGSLAVSYVWDPDRAGEVTYNAELKNVKTNETIPLTDPDFYWEDGMLAFSKDNIPAGSYILTVKLLSGSEVIAGHVEAVRIGASLESTTTENYIEIPIGSKVQVMGITVEDRTGLPIVGTVTTTNGNLKPNGLPNNVTLSYSITDWNGGDAVANAGITATWYADDVLIGTGNDVSYVPVKDSTVITAVFYQEAYEGSIGSISKTIEYVVRPSASGFAEYTP